MSRCEWRRRVRALGTWVSSVLLIGGLLGGRAEARDELLAQRDLGLAVGYVHGFDEFGSGTDEGQDLRGLTVLPHWQTEVGPHYGDGSGLSGRFAFRIEGTLILAFRPRSGVAGGLGLLFRYELDRWDRGTAGLLPYLQVGGGFLGLDLDIEDQADGFAFEPQIGVGLRQRAGRRVLLDYGVRYHHISNAFTKSPNGGIDSVQLVLGIAWRAD